MPDTAATSPTVFPSANDLAAVAGDGKVLKESSLAGKWLASLRPTNYVLTNLTLANTAGLTATINAGSAFISGYSCVVGGATSVVVADASTNWLYLKLLRDGSGNVSAVKFEVNTTGTAPADSVPLYKFVAAGGVITSAVGLSPLGPFSSTVMGPRAAAPGSAFSPEGVFTSSGNFGIQGVHAYYSFLLNTAHTLTMSGRSLVILAETAIILNGTITGTGTGAPAGSDGTDQPGGGGGVGTTDGLAGGRAVVNGLVLRAGGAADGGAGVTVDPHDLARALDLLTALSGGGGGGDGGLGNPVPGPAAGGGGGGSLVLIAPSIVFGPASVITLNGGAGAPAAPGNGGGGGGGGGAGNLWACYLSLQDEGLTLHQLGGGGGAGDGAGQPGGSGASGQATFLMYG